MPPDRRRLYLLGLVLWAGIAAFNRLDDAPVSSTNEAREGVYVRAMLATGNFVLPTVPNHVENGEIIPDKPPLFHWVSAAATMLRALGSGEPAAPGPELSRSFDEWTLRLPSALAACLTVLAVATLGAALVGERAALCAGAILLTTTQFIYQARFGRVDMMLACWVTIAVLLGGRALVSWSRFAPLAAGAAAGLAVLSKGPLGLVLPSLTCAGYALWRRYESGPDARVRSLPWVLAAVIACLVAGPWYAAASAIGGAAFLHSQLMTENLRQFTGLEGWMRGGTYLWPLVLDSLPWNLVALFGLREAWRTRERGAVFCAIWWLALLAFFQIAAYKRRAYLLPALPAEALLAGWVLDRSWLRHEVVEGEVEPALSRASVATLFVLGAAALGAVLADDFPVLGPMARLDAAILLGGAAGAIAASALLVRALWQDRRAAALVYLWLLLSAYLIAAFPSVATATAAGDSSKPLVERVRAVLPADAALTICGVEEDATLPLLLYDPVPEMVTVVHGEAPCLPNLAPGFYLLPEPTWDAIETAAETRRHPWRELFRDDLRGHNKSRPVALVERLRSGSSREVAELAP